MAATTLPWYDQIEGSIWNAATGTLTEAQKQALINQQIAEVTKASGSGPVDSTSIAMQAEHDVTTSLTSNGADPSQASIFNNPGLDAVLQKAGWAIAIIAGAALVYFLIEAYYAFR